MSRLQAGLLNQSSAQVVSGSLKFNDDSSQHITRTPGSAGNRKTWTWSGWIKRDIISAYQHPLIGGSNSTGHGVIVRFSPATAGTDTLQIGEYISSWNWQLITSRLFRDTGWYHIVIAVDTTQTTSSDRVKLYINGTLETSFGTSSYPSLNHDTYFNTNTLHVLGGQTWQGSVNDHYGGRMSNVYFLDGLSLGPGYFGFTDPLTGTWRPKKFRAEGTTVNDGTQWSSQLASNNGNYYSSSYLPAKAFDGDTSTECASQTTGTGGTLTISNLGFTGSSNVRIKVTGSRIDINGSTFRKDSFASTFVDCGTITNLNTIVLYGGPSSQAASIFAVEIDGVIMVDSTTTNLDFGTNGFYLPLDGDSPIGEDKSGKGNNWTPVNFGGSVALDNPQVSGALPILNTTQGGTQAGVGVRTDPYYANLVLALPLLGNKEDVSNQINSGSTTKAVSATGNASASSDTSNFYTGSFEFDGTGDYLDVTESDNCFDFGTGDFTIELWTLLDNNNDLIGTGSNWVYLGSGKSGWVIRRFNEGIKFDYQSNSSWVFENTFGTEASKDKWNHIAITRSGSTMRCFSNGVQQGSDYSNSTNIISTEGYCRVGGGYGENSNLLVDGYIQDVRIYKGVAKYTSNFVVPATSPNILPNTPSGVSGGSKLTKITDGAVHFDGTGDYLEVASTTDFAFGTGDFTLEAYIYATSLPNTNNRIFCSGAGSAGNRSNFQLMVGSAGYLEFDHSTGYQTASGLIGVDKWYHVAATREGTSLKLFIDGVLRHTGTSSVNVTEDGGVTIGREFGYSSYFNGFISNARILKGTALYTANFTPPTRELTNVTNTKLLCCQSNTQAGSAAVGQKVVLLNAPLSSTPFADSSPTGATITNNGSITAVSAGTNSFNITNAASQNGSDQWFTTNNTNISFQGSWTVDIYFKLDSSASGYNALINSGYGTQTSHYMYIGLDDDEKPYLETSSSGSRTTASSALSKNVWYHGRVTQDGSTMTFYVNGTSVVTKTAQTTDLSSAGTFTIGSLNNEGAGANSFHGLIGPVRILATNIGAPSAGGDATSSGTLSNSFGDVVSVNGNAAATNFNPFNTDINTVRGQETGYCTLNPLKKNSNIALSDGNLSAKSTGSHGNKYIVLGTTPFKVGGKFYFETQWMGSDYTFGIARDSVSMANDTNLGADANGYGYEGGGAKTFNSGAQASSFPATTAGDTFGIAVDLSGATGTVQWFKNGVLLNNGTVNAEFTGISLDDDLFPAVCPQSPNPGAFPVNFGQKPFKFPPPAGFQPLNNANVRPETVITRPDKFVDVTTYTGTGASQSISSLAFSPGLLWIKERNTSGYNHKLVDSVRGSTKTLRSSSNGQEFTNTNQVTSFNADGFSLGADNSSPGDLECNQSGKNYVAWAWKAGGNRGVFNVDDVGYASAAAAGLTAGSITPTGASVGTRQGFSIIKFTGTGSAGTLPHGLSQAPGFVVVKNLDATEGWLVWVNGFSSTEYLVLNLTNAKNSNSGYFNGTPSSTTFSVSTANNTNGDGDDMIAYLWHDVPGLQKFGSFEGNGVADGTFVELGFQPSIIWLKNADNSSAPWYILDSERSPFNEVVLSLQINSTGDEGTDTNFVDFLSTGFKMRTSGSYVNANTVMYCAWAEAPSTGLYGAQSTAR